jgi:hypothetical protein
MNSDADRGEERPPDWALAQAMNDREDDDTVGSEERAWKLVRDFEDERHDQDDDPDEGGEA